MKIVSVKMKFNTVLFISHTLFFHTSSLWLSLPLFITPYCPSLSHTPLLSLFLYLPSSLTPCLIPPALSPSLFYHFLFPSLPQPPPLLPPPLSLSLSSFWSRISILIKGKDKANSHVEPLWFLSGKSRLTYHYFISFNNFLFNKVIVGLRLLFSEGGFLLKAPRSNQISQGSI